MQRQQDALDLELRVLRAADLLNQAEDLAEPFHGEVLALQGNDNGVRRDESIDGQQSQGRRTIDKQIIELSANALDVRQALDSGMAAATIMPGLNASAFRGNDDHLRIAFDGDAVLFSDEAERVYQEQGLKAFEESEKASAKNPLPGGPFKQFLSVLHRIQSMFSADESPIRTALITARGAPAHERVIRTLRSWDIRIDEALFLGGMDKSAFLKAFGADIFFDDQPSHCESASRHVPTGHVPQGVTNR